MSEEPGQARPEDSGAGVPPANEPKARREDRWAHRRGEPRIFVFGWTLFLFAATVSTFVVAQSAGINDRTIVRTAARLLVLAAVLGVTILWPMVRLSQSPEPHPVRGTARDLVVLLVPVQAMLWPQAMWWLARWPLPVIGAIDLLLLSWAIVVGGVLALMQAMRLRSARRGHPWTGATVSSAMFLLIALVSAGTLFALVPGPDALTTPDVPAPGFRLAWMLSPFTAVFEITRDQTWRGVVAAVTPAHIGTLALTAAAGLPAWWLASWAGRGRKAAGGLH